MKRKDFLICILVLVVIALGLSYWLAPHHVVITKTKTTIVAEHPIIAGPSRSECVAGPNTGAPTLANDEAAVADFESTTGTTVTCIISYLNGAPSWKNWTQPWAAQPYYGYDAWVAEDPSVRQMVFQLDLIPDSLENINDPLPWETACAAGDYNTHAVAFAEYMVKAGLGNSVIRLGAEGNGAWEADYIGSTTQEQNLWAKCFDNEVTQFRRVKGAHFLIDWNPNATVDATPYANYYPGNKYVDILGLDFYDIAAWTPTVKVLFPSLAHQPMSLAHFEAFAKAHGKPMSFPEWGLVSNPPADDAQYIDGVGDAVETQDFAFESYFDIADGIGNDATVVLSPSTTPKSIIEFNKWFGNGTIPSTTPALPSELAPQHRPPKRSL
jgi:hypothetical protein